MYFSAFNLIRCKVWLIFVQEPVSLWWRKCDQWSSWESGETRKLMIGSHRIRPSVYVHFTKYMNFIQARWDLRKYVWTMIMITNCVTQLKLYTGYKLSSPIFCCLWVCLSGISVTRPNLHFFKYNFLHIHDKKRAWANILPSHFKRVLKTHQVANYG